MPRTTRAVVPLFALVAAVALARLPAAPAQPKVAQPLRVAQAQQTWSASGTLLEACTCAVPCTCNFGQGPSPHDYCHAVWAYRVDKGNWGGTDLSGLVFGGADGSNGGVGFLDERARPAQRLVLEKLARAVFSRGGPAAGPRSFLPARITHEVAAGGTSDLRLEIAGRGGFAARVLIGGDGKTPIVVENNTIWPIRRAVKAKTTAFRFRDERVGQIGGEGTNANYGAYAFTGRTGDAVAVGVTAKASGSCCGPKH